MRPSLSVIAACAAAGTMILASCSGREGPPEPTESPQSRTASPDLAVPEPPGALFDVGGHALHLYCMGEGDRTVLLEAGLGGSSIEFRPLQEELAATTRACAYDRAGMGWSEPGPEPRTGERIVDELEKLLQAAEERGPFVLAGHSFGGLTMLMFAEAHPEDVAGVVLIDSSHPRQDEAFAEIPELAAAQEAAIADLEGMAARAEAGDVGAADLLTLAPTPLPQDLRYQWAALHAQPHSLRTVMAEDDGWAQTVRQVGGDRSLGDIPLIVLARNLGIAEAAPELALTPEEAARADSIWRSLQEDHLARSTNARLVVAEASSHYIHFDEPEVVLAAIRSLATTE